jgi:uncharacterized protein (TIGR00251 family)
MTPHEIVEATADGTVIVAVHVQPRSGTTAITGRHGDALRIRVAAPPVDGRATEAARRALADALGVSATAVELASGERSRLKRFRVEGLALAEARVRIAAILAERG